MEMRDWLIIIVSVAIILILLDGYRRKRKYSIRVKLEKSIPVVNEDLDTTDELPNGGARITSRNDSGEEYDDGYQESDKASDEAGQIVPVLMDAVDIGDDISDKERADSSINDGEKSKVKSEENNLIEEEYDEVEDEQVDEEFSQKLDADSNIRSSTEDRIEPILGKIDSFFGAELEEKFTHVTTTQSKPGEQVEAEESVVNQAELFSESPENFIENDRHEENEGNYLEPEEVIVINVMAKEGELFAGIDLLPILLQHDMQLGEMSIFHNHADSSGDGPIMYSMANMVKPGTFDVTKMEEFSTPGVSFFLQLPNALGNMKSFDQMLNAADSIREKLNGDLKDEHRSVITSQTIEHCRQRIQDFELAQLSKK